MQHLEVSGAVRSIYGSLGVKRLKPSPLTCYRQFGVNSIIVLMFVESQRVHI